MINVVGLTKDEALNKLKTLGLKVTVETKESDKKEGTVLAQGKAEGTELADGATITITVSKKKEQTNNTTKPADKTNTIGNNETTNTVQQ